MEQTLTNFAYEYKMQLINIYKSENIYCLSDWNNVLFDGNNALMLFSDSVYKNADKYKLDRWELGKIETDLIFSISGNIKFCIGNMILYKNCGLNDFNREKINTNGQITTTYHMMPEEQRYLLFASIGFEKLYNFWDRIGDLLDVCLGLGFKTNGKKVYFGTVVDSLKNINSAYLDYLKLYKNNEYDKLNKKRSRIVHHYHLDTYFYSEWQKNMDNISKMKELQEEKETHLNDLIKYNMDTIKGFENACRLIEEQA